jgi:dipeptidyl aminopeptidase/acylaminoacyl peptidase
LADVVAALAVATMLASCVPQPGAGVSAYVSNGALALIELGSCQRRTLVSHGATGPVRFSHDGNWIAFGEGRVVSLNGGRVLRPIGRAVRWQWSPRTDVLAGVTGSGAVVEGRPGGGTVFREPPGWGARNLVWSPGGGSFAVGRGQFTGLPSAKGRQQIVWFSPGERPVAVYTMRRGDLAPPDVVGFGGGDGHLFFQLEMQNSPSLAADGLPLIPLEPARGMAIGSIGTVLPYAGFFTPCGRQIVVAAGGSRDTTTNKRILVARFDPGYDRFRMRNLSRDRSRAWVSPACSPDRRSVAVAAGPDSGGATRVRPRRAIWLLSLDGRSRRALTHPPAGWSDESPLWTANGKAVLVTRQRGDRGRLYLARLDGTLVGPLAELHGDLLSSGYATWPVAAQPHENLAMVGCTPSPGLGVVTYVRGRTRHRANLATCVDRVVPGRVRKSRTPPPLTTADGRFAATVRVTGHEKTLRNTIRVTDRRTGRSRAVYSAKVWGNTCCLTSRGPIELLRWSGDGRWIFFAIDPGGSGSIAADGLILRVVSARGGAAHRLPVMLTWSNYLTWCGGRIVFTAGNDRVAIHHKELDVAAPPDWRARSLVRASGRAWGAVVCAPDRRSVVVQSQPESESANFFATRWQLWRIGLDGSQTRLTSPPAHHADESPHFSRDGKTILFVRSRAGHGRLYALREGRVVGPLLSLGYQSGYYGHQDWWATASWSESARP